MAFLINLVDITFAVASYGPRITAIVNAIAALASAIVTLAKDGSEAVAAMSGYVTAAVEALSALIDAAKNGVDSASTEVAELVEDAQSALTEGFSKLHKLGIMSESTYALYAESLDKKSAEFDELLAKMETEHGA